VKFWVDIYGAHRDARVLSASSWSSELRKRLIVLSAAGHCDQNIKGRFTYSSEGDVVRWSIRDAGKTTPISLQQIPDLATAELSLMALASRGNHLHQFTVMVEGTRHDGSTWVLAVHLPDDRETAQNSDGDRQGLGACSHAALHCHVGSDLDTGPAVRVPLPALGPVEVLEWVLSQLVPTAAFEPAPWAKVVDAIQEASS
jgi:hypothetical protein